MRSPVQVKKRSPSKKALEPIVLEVNESLQQPGKLSTIDGGNESSSNTNSEVKNYVEETDSVHLR